MEIKKLQNEIRGKDWNFRIGKYDSKTIYHTNEWLEFIAESQGLSKVVYEIFLDKEVVGYLPGFIIKKGLIKIFGSPFPGWTTPYMGPLINKTVPQELLFKQIKKLMQKEGYVYAEFCNRVLDVEIAEKVGFVLEKNITYISEIMHEPEAILASYSRSARKSVRRAIRNGLVVETTTNIEKFIEIYYLQLQEVFLKSNMLPTYSKERVKLLIKKLLPSNKILLTWVKFNEKVIACRIDMIEGVWMNSFGSSSSREFLKLNPNELARYHVMCIGAERGIKHYDMSGGGKYKSKFGSERIINHKIIYDRFHLYGIRNMAKEIIRLKNKIVCKINKKG